MIVTDAMKGRVPILFLCLDLRSRRIGQVRCQNNVISDMFFVA
jgi:hypothetical protein